MTRSRLDAVREGLWQRRLHELAPAERAIVLVLIGFSGLALVLTGLLIFGRGPVDSESALGWHAVCAVVIFAGLLVSMSILAGTSRPPSQRGWVGRVQVAIDVLLPYVGVVVLAYSVLISNPAVLANVLQCDPVLPALGLWLGLTIGCLFGLRRVQRASSGLLDGKRVAAVAVPAAILLALALASLTIERSAVAVASVLQPALLLAAFTAVVVLPAVSAGGAAKGLDALRNRGERAARLVRARPWLIVAVGVAKVVVIGALWALWRSRSPQTPTLGSSLGAWLLSGGTALVVVALFAVNRRIGLAASDHLVVSRTSGVVLGGSLAPLVVLAFLIGTTGVVLRQPLVLIGVAGVIGAGLLAGKAGTRTARLTAYGCAVVLAAGAATMIPSPAGVIPVGMSEEALNVPLAGRVLLIGLAVGVIAVIVLIIAKRRLAWLVYLTAVAMWIVLFHVLKPRWAPDMTMLNLDLALTVLLTLSAVLLARGIQREIDAFEITVTMAVTFLVIELPLISGLMPFPETIKLWLAVTALLGAAIGSVWSATGALARTSEQGAAMVRLATSTLLYYLLLALASLLKNGATDVIKNIEGFALGYLTVPLVLLLVAAGESAGRDKPAAAQRGGLA